jgi:hypothetical protein
MKNFMLFLVSAFLIVSCSSGNKGHVNQIAHHAPEEIDRSIASEKATIEQWKGSKGIKFVYRNKMGEFKSWGTLSFETWVNDSQSKWVARLENGQFVTGYTGKTEKFDVGTGREELRVVIRTATGQFVSWKSLDALVTAKFDSWDINGDGDKETVYVVRYDGKFLNWAPAKLEQWDNFSEPVLVVRDTADGRNNGKLLGWIAPAKYKSGPNKGKVYYKDPETGRFVSSNK